MFDAYSDIIAYSLLILLLGAMGLAAWLRYRILPSVRAALPSPQRSIGAGESPGAIPEQHDTRRAISTDEDVEVRRLRAHTLGRDKAGTDGDGASMRDRIDRSAGVRGTDARGSSPRRLT